MLFQYHRALYGGVSLKLVYTVVFAGLRSNDLIS